MLTVLTWLWKQPGGRENYNAEHVNIWAAMVRRHLDMDHRIACVTDDPRGLDSYIEVIPTPRDFVDVRNPHWGPAQPQCLRRLVMFRRDAADIFGEWFVSMDLDTVIGGNLDPLFDPADDFRMYRGTSKVRPYNGSMILLRAGARPQVYDDFTPELSAEASAAYVGSDQAWISYRLGWGERTWDTDDGAMWFGNRFSRDEADWRVMFFPGYPKPWHVAKADPAGPWIARNYRRTVRKAA